MLNTFLTYKHCMSYQNETTLNEFLRKDVRLYCDGETYLRFTNFSYHKYILLRVSLSSYVLCRLYKKYEAFV